MVVLALPLGYSPSYNPQFSILLTKGDYWCGHTGGVVGYDINLSGFLIVSTGLPILLLSSNFIGIM